MLAAEVIESHADRSHGGMNFNEENFRETSANGKSLVSYLFHIPKLVPVDYISQIAISFN